MRFFSFHDAHPKALVLVLMKAFDLEWVEWEPEVLKEEIVKEFQATGVSHRNWGKIQACRTLMTSRGFWEEYNIFSPIIQALNNNDPSFDTLRRAEISQLMAGVDMAFGIERGDFSDEIKGYVAACAIDAGIMFLPPPLDFAQLYLSDVKYVCKVCGNVDSLDLEDGRCDLCTSRYKDVHNLNGRAADGVPPEVGTQISVFATRDPGEVRKRFQELMLLGSAELNDNDPVDVQTAKLVVAHKYMLLRRSQLDEQLKELGSWVTR